MTRRTAVAAAITAAATIAVAAPVVGQTAESGHHPVAINDLGYAPATVVAAPGQHVIWTNGGTTPHTATADSGAFDSGTLQPKAKFDLVAPATPGSYTYYCLFHSYMRGTLQVQPGVPLPTPPVARVLSVSAPRTARVGSRVGIVARFSAAPLGAVALQHKVSGGYRIVGRAPVRDERARLSYKPAKAGQQVLRVRFRTASGFRYSRLIALRVREAAS
jgi:plastocyanin